MTTLPLPAQPVTASTPGVIHVRRPADGCSFEDVVISDSARVAQIAQSLREAQLEWDRIGIRGRTKWLELYREWILDNSDRLADLEQQEGGRVRTEALLEQNIIAELVNTYARTAPKLLASKRVRGSSALLMSKRFKVANHPFPLVGVIGAWNYPLLLSIGDAVPALFAGCAVLLKPSEVTPLGVREAVRGWRDDVGAPPVLDVVFGAAATGEAVVDEVDYVQFTGSAATGTRVAQRAAQTITPVSLELGGKDPAIVLRTANIKRAANGVVYGAFANNGQVCISLERVYVESPVYDEFVDHVVGLVESLRSGTDGPAVAKDVGAMTTPAQLAIVEDHVQDAIAKGATVLTGGKRIDRPGDWYEPTVLADVDHTMKVMTEETFGPVLPIMKVADVDEAIRLSNDSVFGLSASVFAGTALEGEQVAARIDCGSVNVNDFAINAMCPTLPMGGWKTSGVGVRSGDYGLLKYTRQKAISSNRFGLLDKEIWWFPYTARRQGLMRKAVRLVHSRGLGRLGKPTYPPVPR